MSTLPANPLQSLIKSAATTLPATTGAVEPYAERLRRIRNRDTVVLADVSGSMDSPAWGGRTKHAVLREAIDDTMRRVAHRTFAFSSDVREITSAADLPPAGGHTALHRAIDRAGELRPGRILVVSDGEPDDETAALAAARAFDGVIDVLYIGPDSNAAAMAFLRRLSEVGHGRYQGSDIARAGQPALAHTLQQLLLTGSS